MTQFYHINQVQYPKNLRFSIPGADAFIIGSPHFLKHGFPPRSWCGFPTWVRLPRINVPYRPENLQKGKCATFGDTQCGKVLRLLHSYNQHRYDHEDTWYKCYCCGQDFYSWSLAERLGTHREKLAGCVRCVVVSTSEYTTWQDI